MEHTLMAETDVSIRRASAWSARRSRPKPCSSLGARCCHLYLRAVTRLVEDV